MNSSYLLLKLIVAALMVWSATAQEPGASGEADSGRPAQSILLGAPIQTSNPQLPKELRKKQLVAVLSATLAANGSVENVKTLGGDPEFASLALNAVQHWRYAPATADGQPVAARIFITLQSQKGKVHSEVEPDTLPTEPPTDLAESGGAGRVLRVVDSHTMQPPRAVFAPDPEYSEKARKAKYQGTAILGLVVGQDGEPKAVWMVKKLGLGLDEKALDAVRRWKFDPATKDGEPVAVFINVEVSFRLY